jgi:hypothetical protein
VPDAPSGEPETGLPVPQHRRSGRSRHRLTPGSGRRPRCRAAGPGTTADYSITSTSNRQVHQLHHRPRRSASSRLAAPPLGTRFSVLRSRT